MDSHAKPETFRSKIHSRWLEDDRNLLEGPRSRTAEFFRVIRILREFLRGFRELHFLGSYVTVFGSARFDEGHRYYQLACEVGAAVANLGFTVMTGGGPGLMEAANRALKLPVVDRSAAISSCPKNKSRTRTSTNWLRFATSSSAR